MRVIFNKSSQRKFFDLVIEKTNSPSLRALLQFGLNVNYSSLKNYYSEARLISEELFNDLCTLARIDLADLDFFYLDENWGKVKGGKIGRRKKLKRKSS